MALKEELEILRGEPIEVFTGDPMGIPCVETSDAEKLCRHPVVSVQMCAYNHEPYIRQAIEGVMMQQTDFEFELLIGEDCSQDKTREICFECQKKYPDKIRVLWWHENVSRLGGNSRRVQARCRGEFIALCEGDDYWIDPLKLQKQVEAFRLHPSAGLCFAQAKIINEITGVTALWASEVFPEGFMQGWKFFLWHGFGKTRIARMMESETFIMTASVMVRRSICVELLHKYDIFKWRLFLGDSILWLGVASVSDVIFLKSPVSVYRKNVTGTTRRNGAKIGRDGVVVRLYYAVKVLGIPLKSALWHLRNVYTQILFCWISSMTPIDRGKMLLHIRSTPYLSRLFHTWRSWPLWILMRFGMVSPFFVLWGSRFILRMPMAIEKDDPFNKLYDKIDQSGQYVG